LEPIRRIEVPERGHVSVIPYTSHTTISACVDNGVGWWTTEVYRVDVTDEQFAQRVDSAIGHAKLVLELEALRQVRDVFMRLVEARLKCSVALADEAAMPPMEQYHQAWTEALKTYVGLRRE
jgi:hypothetical protein